MNAIIILHFSFILEFIKQFEYTLFLSPIVFQFGIVDHQIYTCIKSICFGSSLIQ